jgi:hypothetical protein
MTEKQRRDRLTSLRIPKEWKPEIEQAAKELVLLNTESSCLATVNG